MTRLLVPVAVLATALVACGRSSDGAAPPADVFERRAAMVAAAWHSVGGGFLPLQQLTIAPANGFPDDAAKQAFAAGWYKTSMALPDQSGSGTIRYPDGTSAAVPLVSATAAYQAIDQGDAGCPNCVSLLVTGAKLETVGVRTIRGQAMVPAWLFDIEGLQEPIARVAVAPEAIEPLPTPSLPPHQTDPPLVSAQDLTAVRGNIIEYRLGVGACDEDITGLVWESPHAVVIGGSVTPPGTAQSCTAQLVLHPTSVTTREPVGDRIILDAVTGAPVPLR